MAINLDLVQWLDEKITHLFGGIHKRWDDHYKNIRKDTIFLVGNGSTDSSGNASITIARAIPDGKIFIVERLVAWMDGYTPASVTSTGWVALHHGPGRSVGSIADFAPESSGAQVFPAVAEYNHNNAPRFKGGEQVMFECYGVVASKNVSVIVQGCMENESYRS